MNMSTHTRLLLALALILTVNACDSLAPPNANKSLSAMAGPAVAVVNGKEIPQALFDTYIKQRAQRQPPSGAAGESEQILKEFIDMELLYQDAQRKGLGERPDIRGVLELQERNILIRTLLQQYATEHPVTEEDQKAAYDEQITNRTLKEYKARHILTKTKEEAEAIVKQLDEGGDFAALAKEHSTGPSANQGGDLGWFPPDRMVASFSAAVSSLEKETYTKEPIETQFGWHVILLEDKRPTTPPTFEQSKQQIGLALQRQRLEDYIETLRTKAQIDIKNQAAAQ